MIPQIIHYCWFSRQPMTSLGQKYLERRRRYFPGYEIRDNWYIVICSAYCLCNAFLVMVIRSAFSNRFAYLS